MALKILLAEDEKALSRVYKAALEHQGFEVDQAFNGQEAVRPSCTECLSSNHYGYYDAYQKQVLRP